MKVGRTYGINHPEHAILSSGSFEPDPEVRRSFDITGLVGSVPEEISYPCELKIISPGGRSNEAAE